MRAGETYEGRKAMANHPRFTIISMAGYNGRLVRIETDNGFSYLSAEKTQNNIDLGFLVRVNG